MTLIKEVSCKTTHSILGEDHLCAPRRERDLTDTQRRRRRRRRRRSSETKKAVEKKTSTEDNTDTTPPIWTTYSTGDRIETSRRYWCVNWSRPLDWRGTRSQGEAASPHICLLTVRGTTPAATPPPRLSASSITQTGRAHRLLIDRTEPSTLSHLQGAVWLSGRDACFLSGSRVMQ